MSVGQRIYLDGEYYYVVSVNETTVTLQHCTDGAKPLSERIWEPKEG